MDFLFRAPLFDFDPDDDVEIAKNWENICGAIKNSSQSLSSELQGKQYHELSPKVKIKVFKYIIRGRYRPTPFGFFAGVGTGEFKERFEPTLNLDRKTPLPDLHQTPPVNSELAIQYKLAQGIHRKLGRIYFLSYLPIEQRWAQINIPDNKLIRYLIEQTKNSGSIDFESFKLLLTDPTPEFLNGVWKKLIEIGLLIQTEQDFSGKGLSGSIDLVFQNKLSLPHSVFDETESLKNTGGNLFLKFENQYLNFFQSWFQNLFDDRFVPLSFLLEHHCFIKGEFLSTKGRAQTGGSGSNFEGSLWETEQLDLKKLIPSKPLDKSIYDLQMVFRLGNNHIPIFENFVCNRPFVYFGRFNRDPDIYNLQHRIKESVYPENGVIYAELLIFETPEIQNICKTKPVFNYSISPFPTTDPYSIAIKDLYLGIVSEELVLLHKNTGKRVIPLVLHPLNGKEISHPIFRFLWELAHQCQFKFFPYQHQSFLESRYTPQLNWGKIILQSKRWGIKKEEFKSPTELFTWLEEKSVCEAVMCGYLDRELILKWRKKEDFEILWSELQKYQKLNLSDPVWLHNSPYYSQNRKQIYPQIIYQIGNDKKDHPIPSNPNFIEFTEPKCLYLIVNTPFEEIQEHLQLYFSPTFINYLDKNSIKWFFLFYPEGEKIQIRIRFLNLGISQKNEVLKRFSQQLLKCNLSYITRPYYPEIQKYGNPGFKISETLFYLESQFLLSIGLNRERIIGWNENKRSEIIVNLWFEILRDSEFLSLFFEALKKKVKDLDKEKLKEIRKRAIPEKKDSVKNEFYSLYKKTINAHPQLQKGNRERLILLFNHLHVQINRFFPGESMFWEECVHYLIYRELGRKIYAGRSL